MYGKQQQKGTNDLKKYIILYLYIKRNVRTKSTCDDIESHEKKIVFFSSLLLLYGIFVYVLFAVVVVLYSLLFARSLLDSVSLFYVNYNEKEYFFRIFCGGLCFFF